MTSLETIVNSYRYITYSQLRRLLSLSYADSTLRNLKKKITADLDEGLYEAEGTEKPRGDWLLKAKGAKATQFDHALAITDELIDFEFWARDMGYKFEFKLNPVIGKIIPDAEIFLKLENMFCLIFLEVEWSNNRPKLEKYIEAQNEIKEYASHKWGDDQEPKDFHFHLKVVNV